MSNRNCSEEMNGARQPILILGTRTFAFELADLISDIPAFELVGFVENWDREKCRETLDGYPIWWVDDIAHMAATHKAVCSLATTRRSLFTQQVEALGFSFAAIVHPTARISKTSTLALGSIASVGSIIAAHSVLGEHVLVNRGAIVGHHCQIGSFVNIQSGCNIGGNTQIGDATYVGMGATVLNNLKIGSHSVIGAGAVVTKDVPDHVQVVGVPARIVKENIDGL